VKVRGLVLTADPPTEKAQRRLHVEFDCPFDPSQIGKGPHERLKSVAERDLREARNVIARVCAEDQRFARLVEESGVVFEYAHRYGMGALLVATAGASGELIWRCRPVMPQIACACLRQAAPSRWRVVVVQ
jgi:hypothetical protein